MTFDEFQVAATRTNGQILMKDMILNGTLGLAGESGEVVEIIKKWLFHDKPICFEQIALELGDVLWYLASICEGLGTTLELVAELNVEKLRKRYEHGFTPGGGVR